MALLEALLAWREALPVSVSGLLVGFSGGCDSQVLLHALQACEQVAPRFSLRAIHIHHGLHPQADTWVQHCETVCASLSIPFLWRAVALVPAEGESVENVAREARYAVFSEILTPGEVLVTAHHLEDQAETVLLQLLRGSGIKGLSAMPAIKSFSQGWHARPLLDVSQAVLHDYAKTQGFTWIEDSSNNELRFTRNRLRHQVMPVLATMNPSYAHCLARSAQHCQSSMKLLEEYGRGDLAVCLSADQGLIIRELSRFSFLRQQHILREWLQKSGYPLPSVKKLHTILQQMIGASRDAKPCVEWGKWQVQRIKGEMRVSAREKYRIASS